MKTGHIEILKKSASVLGMAGLGILAGKSVTTECRSGLMSIDEGRQFSSALARLDEILQRVLPEQRLCRAAADEVMQVLTPLRQAQRINGNTPMPVVGNQTRH
jgi:hypothetical protein